MRLCACLGVAMDLIEPCGFLLDDRHLKRSAMDYRAGLDLTRHLDWTRFEAGLRAKEGRLVLLTTRASQPYTGFAFAAGDTLLVGSESAGVPAPVHERADARIAVPMAPGLRSLNVAVAAAMVLGEALRQTDLFPPLPSPTLPKA